MAKKTSKNPTSAQSILKRPRKFSWKIFSVLAVSLIIVGYLVVRLSHAATYDGYQRLRIVNVAASQIGQREYSPQVLAYTEGHQESWCADFVSWVYMAAGYPFVTSAAPGRSYWRIPLAWKQIQGVPNLRDYFISQSAWRPGGRAGSYTPGPGDVIIFGDIESHTGIVESVDYPANKEPQVHTIEGNASDQVMRRVYTKSDANISGYGTIISSGPTGATYKY